MNRKFTRKEFIETYDAEINQKFRVTADWVYDEYYDKIYLNLDLITRWYNMEKPMNLEELRIGLGVSLSVFMACKVYFPEFRAKLESKYNTMKFKSERDLMRGIEESHSNPKLQFQMYNDDFKPKGTQIEVNIPKMVAISFDDESSTEKDIEDNL